MKYLEIDFFIDIDAALMLQAKHVANRLKIASRG